jgi:hypothetical protein
MGSRHSRPAQSVMDDLAKVSIWHNLGRLARA